jgi:hypothetical protein
LAFQEIREKEVAVATETLRITAWWSSQLSLSLEKLSFGNFQMQSNETTLLDRKLDPLGEFAGDTN